MSESRILSIQNNEQRLGLLPELGGSAAFWEVQRNGEWCALWRPYAPTQDEKRTVANFPLLPFSNRITCGGITVAGVFHPMTPNRPGAYPIHGTAWMHAWDVVTHSDNVIELAVESRRKHDYPWEYRATQRYSLNGGDMVMRLEVEHIGAQAMPYGLGWHPYILRGADADGPRVQFKTDGYWNGTADGIPTEHVGTLPADWDFNAPRRLGEGRIDHNFSGWDGRLTVERDDIDVRITSHVTQPTGLDTVIVFRPENQPFFAIEPVTHITDAFNRPGMPGLRMLKQGERMVLEVVQTLSRIG
jgi:aldose 1-epimerase